MKTLSSVFQFIKGAHRSAAEKRKQREQECADQQAKICNYCHGSGIDNTNPVNPLVGQPSKCPICGGRGRYPL